MADIENPSFESQGLLVGQADAWAESNLASAVSICMFQHQNREVPFEDFEEEWTNHGVQDAFASGDTIWCPFEGGTRDKEDFEYSWIEPRPAVEAPPFNHAANDYFSESDLTYAPFDSGAPETVEDYEEEWLGNHDAQATLADPGDITWCDFDVGMIPYENFETTWSDNELSQTSMADPGDITWCDFDVGMIPYEDFEGAWTETLTWP